MLTITEYESQMAALNREIQERIAPLQEQINKLSNHRSDIKRKIAKLRIQESEVASRHIQLCDQVRRIRQSYNQRKTDIYLQRPISASQIDTDNNN